MSSPTHVRDLPSAEMQCAREPDMEIAAMLGWHSFEWRKHKYPASHRYHWVLKGREAGQTKGFKRVPQYAEDREAALQLVEWFLGNGSTDQLEVAWRRLEELHGFTDDLGEYSRLWVMLASSAEHIVWAVMDAMKGRR